jgi:hypothetical protein
MRKVLVTLTFVSIGSEQKRNTDKAAFLQLSGRGFSHQITIDHGRICRARRRCTVYHIVQALNWHCAKAIQELRRVLATHTGRDIRDYRSPRGNSTVDRCSGGIS